MLATETIRSAPSKSGCKHLSSTKSIARFDFTCLIEFPTMTAGLLQRQCHVPVAVSRRRGVGNDVLVDPFDGVADFCRSFRRRDHQIFHRDLNGSRHAPRQTLLTSALRQPGVSISASWEAPYFRAGGDAFGMLLVALENLETSL